MKTTDKELKYLLDSLVERFNVPSFADNDPLGFPRRFSDKRDIEISAMVTSTISWGKRAMILNNAQKIHDIMDNQPYKFILEGDIDAIGEGNIHRTFFGCHLRYLLRGLRELYVRYGSLEDFAHSVGCAASEAPAWLLAEKLGKFIADANVLDPLEGPSRCLPDNVSGSALKRFNMMLRWLVRNDGKADIGCWEVLTPAQLFIPLDVHSGNTGRQLGLLNRKANDRRAAVELTESLRILNPQDPTIYDFALFSVGETKSQI